MYGSTGDVTPWHGYPICPDSLPDCYLDDDSEEVKISPSIIDNFSQFLEYVRFTNLVFYTEYQLTQPRIHLVLNGGGALDEWNWENIPEHWLKRGMVSHGYQLNTERETEEKYMEQVIPIRSSIQRAGPRRRGWIPDQNSRRELRRHNRRWLV